MRRSARRNPGNRLASPKDFAPLHPGYTNCAQTRFGGDDLGPAEEEALAQIDQLPAPFPDFASHLRRLAAGQLPAIPASLPTELRQIIEPVARAIQDARPG